MTDYLQLAGQRLEYRWFGPTPAEAPTLVLLHEGLGCVALWKDFPAQLAAATGCGVLVYSRAGYGASSPVELPRPLTYMHAEGLSVLPQVLDAAGVRECVLVGHSDGASIALIHAGGVGDPRVRGLVLLAPHVFNEAVCVASIQQAKTAYETGRLREQLARYHGDNVDCAFWGWNGAWLDPGFWHWNIEEYLAGISVPVLVIQGEDDEYGTVRQVEAIQAQVAGPVEVRLLPACQHSPHRDQPAAVQAALLGFVGPLLL